MSRPARPVFIALAIVLAVTAACRAPARPVAGPAAARHPGFDAYAVRRVLDSFLMIRIDRDTSDATRFLAPGYVFVMAGQTPLTRDEVLAQVARQPAPHPVPTMCVLTRDIRILSPRLAVVTIVTLTHGAPGVTRSPSHMRSLLTLEKNDGFWQLAHAYSQPLQQRETAGMEAECRDDDPRIPIVGQRPAGDTMPPAPVGAAPRVADQSTDFPPRVYLRPALYGTIFDSTGAGVHRVSIQVSGRRGFSYSDSLGRYLLFDLPPGPQEIRFFCPVARSWRGKLFARRTVTILPSTDDRLDFSLSFVGCDEPPERTIEGEFAGRWTAGFEASNFEPCRPFEDLSGTAYEGRGQSAWIDRIGPGPHRVSLPPIQDADGYQRLFIRWRGRITGPGSYGHLGVHLYWGEIVELLEARKASAADCR